LESKLRRLIDHIGDEKIPRQNNVQQWGILVNGLTAELATWKKKGCERMDSVYILIMTVYINVLTNYVPAVAAIRKRLVLFILNRFKGYLDGKISL
jgi:hypothetical protein